MTVNIDDSSLEQLEKRLQERAFDSNCCFLCARHFDEIHITSEHVFPKWLQKRFNLWDEKLVLLNNTLLPYRLFTVPCCEECNKYYLNSIETTLSNTIEKGINSFRALNSEIVFLWLGKIFYGILYREISLLFDRSNPNSSMIASPELLHQYEHHLLLLQQIREKVKITDFVPGSMYYFKCQVIDNPRLQWDFCDNIDTLFIGIRMGEVGVIGVLGDGGAQMTFSNYYDKFKDLPLHPMQFREICSQISYRSSLATRKPKRIVIQGSPHSILQMPLGGLSLKPYFEGWEDRDYARVLSFYTEVTFEQIYKGPGRIGTWLQDDSGEVRYIDWKSFPVV